VAAPEFLLDLVEKLVQASGAKGVLMYGYRREPGGGGGGGERGRALASRSTVFGYKLRKAQQPAAG
jgi:hypothetical protein